MKRMLIGGCLLAVFSFQVALADSMKNNPGISMFAECSRQCMKDNEACKQKASQKCAKDDETCLDACNIAYPDCMAKCPKPGS